ncbi:flagellar filament capping protein FliD [Halomonas huangheensis]|uniref:Flagellar hook-associated protein 2 n=1 Tax=Halomonas huangheensis TaxID=1178482 RepID=W1N6Q7_9GAMM|nr:flagellar filament capping protein FliD [Halomonas huangheensis]ALM54270.1 flagellar hook protein [Halomonas huangheensis]ERL50821.1 hypothetical protein BJB45_19690 [Halomonas huangheensis]
MPSISSLGIGSGLDLNGLLDQLEAAERKQLEPIAAKQNSYEAKISAYGKLESALSSFQDAVSKLKDPALFSSLSSSVEGDGITASDSSSAQAGRYEVSVTQLARSQSLATSGMAERDSQLGGGTLSLGVGGENVDIEISEENSSLEGIRDAINASDAGVSASIVNDGDPDTPYRLVLTSKETGSEASVSSMSFSASGSETGLESVLSFDATAATNAMEETVSARNAELTVNGIAISSPSNKVEGAIEGVTLTLNETGDNTIKVENDNFALRDAIKTFVSSYNNLQSTTDSLTSFDSESGAAGELLGDATLRNIDARLRNGLTSSAAAGSLNSLSDLGITLQLDGTLELDAEKLDDVITHQRGDLATFFSGTTDASGEPPAAGFATQLATTLGNILDDGGLLDNATTGFESRLETLDAQYLRTEKTINSTVERYRQQFGQLDTLIANMNQTSDYLTQQFDALNAQTGK